MTRFISGAQPALTEEEQAQAAALRYKLGVIEETYEQADIYPDDVNDVTFLT